MSIPSQADPPFACPPDGKIKTMAEVLRRQKARDAEHQAEKLASEVLAVAIEMARAE